MDSSWREEEGEERRRRTGVVRSKSSKRSHADAIQTAHTYLQCVHRAMRLVQLTIQREQHSRLDLSTVFVAMCKRGM